MNFRCFSFVLNKIRFQISYARKNKQGYGRKENLQPKLVYDWRQSEHSDSRSARASVNAECMVYGKAYISIVNEYSGKSVHAKDQALLER